MSIFSNGSLISIMARLTEEDIDLLITKDMKGNTIVDVQTMAKSHLHLGVDEESGVITAYMRYNETKEIEDVDALLYAVKDCLCGRGYISGSWAALLQKEGVLGEEW